MTPLVAAYVLSALVGLGIIFVGGRFLVAPSVGATGYGVAPGKGAYLSAKRRAGHRLWLLCVRSHRQRRTPRARLDYRRCDIDSRRRRGDSPAQPWLWTDRVRRARRHRCGHVGGRHVVPSFQLILSRANPFRFAGADARRTSDSRAALRGLDDVASCAYAMTFRKALDRGRENRRFFSAAARIWLTATAPDSRRNTSRCGRQAYLSEALRR